MPTQTALSIGWETSHLRSLAGEHKRALDAYLSIDAGQAARAAMVAEARYVLASIARRARAQEALHVVQDGRAPGSGARIALPVFFLTDHVATSSEERGAIYSLCEGDAAPLRRTF